MRHVLRFEPNFAFLRNELPLACWTITEKTQPTPLVQVANQSGSAVLQPGQPNLLWLMMLILVLVYAKHAANIKRLMDGKEPKIGKKKKNTSLLSD